LSSKWSPNAIQMGPRRPFGRTLDSPRALWGLCWSFWGLLGRPVVLLGSSLGALGGSLGGLGSDFGCTLGVFLINSGAFFRSQARLIMKRYFLGLRQHFVCFLSHCKKRGDRSHSKNPYEFATCSCHARGFSFPGFVSIYLVVFFIYGLMFLNFEYIFLYSWSFFDTFLSDTLFFTLWALMRLQNE